MTSPSTSAPSRFSPSLLSSINKSLFPFGVEFKLCENESDNYGLYATRPHPIGSVVLSTLPLVTLLLPSVMAIKCDNCHLAVSSTHASSSPSPSLPSPLLRCSSCHLYSYCSRKCQNLSWKEHHKHECKILSKGQMSEKIHQFTMTNEWNDALIMDILMLLRYLMKTKNMNSNDNEKKEESDKDNNNNNNNNNENKQKSKFLINKDSDGTLSFPFHPFPLLPYPSPLIDHPSLFSSLPSHFHSIEEKKKESELSPSLSTQFHSNDSLISLFFSLFPSLSSSYSKTFLFDILYRFSNNNFSLINDLYAGNGSVISSFTALLNHSCKPNCIIGYENREDEKGEIRKIQLVRNIYKVEKGDQLCHSYLDILENNYYSEREKRREKIFNSYHFHCQCELCQITERNNNNNNNNMESYRRNFHSLFCASPAITPMDSSSSSLLDSLIEKSKSLAILDQKSDGEAKVLLSALDVISKFYSPFHCQYISLLSSLLHSFILITSTASSASSSISSTIMFAMSAIQLSVTIANVHALIYSDIKYWKSNEKNTQTLSHSLQSEMDSILNQLKGRKWVLWGLKCFSLLSQSLSPLKPKTFSLDQMESELSFLFDDFLAMRGNPHGNPTLCSQCVTHHPIVSIQIYTISSLFPYLLAIPNVMDRDIQRVNVTRMMDKLVNRMIEITSFGAHLLIVNYGEESKMTKGIKRLKNDLMAYKEEKK